MLLTREQLEDRLAALHRASLELVSNLSLDTVLERIVEMAREQADAHYAALGVVDPAGNLIQFIPVGMTQKEINHMEHPPVGRGLLGLFRHERTTIRVADISSDPRSIGFPEHHPAMRSFLGVPILSGKRMLGQLYLTDKQNYPEFTAQDEVVIETLAAYAAVAIANARLYSEILDRDQALTQRNDDLSLINDVASTLAGSLEVDVILDKTLGRVITYLGVEAGEIYLREDNEQNLRLAIHRGEYSDPFAINDSFRVGEGFVGRVAEIGEPLISMHPHEEMHFLRASVIKAGFQCIACIPLTASGRVVGVLSVATRQNRQISQRELNLLTAIGSWAAIAIENARLHRQARRLAVLEERERIGMDLHDGIIQSIYGVGLALEYARMEVSEDPTKATQKIEQSVEALNSAIRDIRAYILDLRPRQFHGDDLKQGIQRLVEEFQANSGTRATLTGSDEGLVDFPAPNATALFHICQEALANVAKHSHAKQVEINLWSTRDRVLLEINDDGQGFDISKMSVTLGHGLSNMHVRARKVGGDVEITSFPNEGTSILAWVPTKA